MAQTWRKAHYEAIAAIFQKESSADTMLQFIEMFEADCPGFKRNKFIEACGWSIAHFEACHAPPNWDELDKYIRGERSIYGGGTNFIIAGDNI